jgi:peptidoglycan/xylan/chitin deacetylase (PgdA/CDA1 family)
MSTAAGSSAVPAAARPRIVVIFRNDDPSACSDVAHERRVAEIFEKYGVPQTIGVVPCHAVGDTHDPTGTDTLPLDRNRPMVEFLREYVARSGSEVALHGLTHRTGRKSQPARREYFEFRRLTAAEQAGMLRRGTSVVVEAIGIRPTTFIPPWNRLDHATLRACAEVGLEVASAGPFTSPHQAVMALGTDCSTASLPDRLGQASGSPDRVLLRVLYHSPTTRSEEALAALERAVRCAVETEGCEVLTLAETARRYPDDVRLANEAARNIVPQDEVLGSDRARAVVYHRLLRRLGLGRRLEACYRQARRLYERGRYTDTCRLSPTIDRLCRRTLRTGRAIATVAGGALGLGLAAAVATAPWSTRLTVDAAAAILAALAGLAGRVLVTAEDSKREAGVVSCLLALGALAGAALAELAVRVGP